jgi:MYXO-CTERM domain-containing protein
MTRLFAITSLALFSSVAIADTGDNTGNTTGISDTETSYSGAQILEGDRDVTFGEVGAGQYANEEQDTYAFFSGNTMYVGAEDADGNAVDAIVEFFWFESSIDRGSDFYVAVIKARTTPHVSEDWYLETGDSPVLAVEATADISGGTQAFRWDWSIPFDSYGIDSYGDATLTTSYGIGTTNEGSLIVAETVEEDGATATANVQAKGYLNADYKVQATYQVTLYRWDVVVRGSPDIMRWELGLNTSDRQEQSAYHEYFLVMQAEEDTEFVIENLDIGASVQNWWTWSDTLGVVVSDIKVARPEGWDDGLDDTGTPFPFDTDDPADDTGDSGDGSGDDTGDDTGEEGDEDGICGCSATPGTPAAVSLFLLGLGLAVRRRE